MKKNILVLVPIFYPHYGGAEKAIFELYKNLSNEYEIDLLTPNFGGKKFENNGYFNIFRVCKSTNSILIKLFKYQFFQIKTALKLAKSKKYDLIHSHYVIPTGFASLFLKWKLKIPWIVTEHHFGTGMDISSYKENPIFLNPIMKYLYFRADKVISTGKTQNLFLDFISNKKLKYNTIYLGGDCNVSKLSKFEILKKLDLPKNKKIVFSISRLVYRKRYDIFIESAKKILEKRDDIIFIIGGIGPELDNIRFLIKKYNIEKNVKLIGFVSDSDLEKYRKISEIFVTSSQFEGAGIIYLEAFCSRIPLFAKKNIASNDLIKSNLNGFLFKDSNELSKLILNYIDDKSLLYKIAKNAHKEYIDKYNWKNHSIQYSLIYSKFIK